LKIFAQPIGPVAVSVRVLFLDADLMIELMKDARLSQAAVGEQEDKMGLGPGTLNLDARHP
jgi:hypothetical protein